MPHDGGLCGDTRFAAGSRGPGPRRPKPRRFKGSKAAKKASRRR